MSGKAMTTTTLQTTVPTAVADPLVAALVFVGRHFGRAISPETVTRALPLENGLLPMGYFVEAAERAGLAARESAFSAADLKPMTLPVIALTRTGGAWVVLSREGDRLQVWSGDGDAVRWIAADALDAELAGRGFFVQARLYFDARSQLYDPLANKDWFWGPLRANWWIYAYGGLASLAINGLAMVSGFYVMAVYDRVIPNQAIDTLWVLTIGVVVLYLLDLAFKTIRSYLINTASRRFDLEVGSRVFAKMLATKSDKRPQSAGTLANTVREFESLREFFTSATLTAIGDVPFLLGFVAVILIFAGPVALAPTLAIPVILGVSWAFMYPLGRLIDVSYKEAAQRNALLYETVTGLDALKVQGAEGWARRQWDRLLAQNTDTLLKTREWGTLAMNATLEIQALVGVGVIVSAALLVADGKLSTGAMVACTILSGRALTPLTQVAGLISRFHGTRAALAALDKMMQAPTEDDSELPLMHLPRLQGEVAFREVTFAYADPSSPSGTKVPVLKELSFSVKAGEQVAVLGRVGSGKSTLLSLLLKLQEPDEGHIVVDGLDVRQIASADLRAQMGVVPQEPYLFHGTIRENLTMGHPGASEAQILDAARIAGLDELLAGTAEGLNMQVGEGGKRLSGGTRQAVAIARALISAPPVLLMDEPTSMMDHTTEQKILARLGEARRGKTTIIVTHRPSVLAIVDRMIVVEGGRVVADGPKEQVLARLKGA
jgi:ATP-binding cassette subfamily C protein LapB